MTERLRIRVVTLQISLNHLQKRLERYPEHLSLPLAEVLGLHQIMISEATLATESIHKLLDLVRCSDPLPQREGLVDLGHAPHHLTQLMHNKDKHRVCLIEHYPLTSSLSTELARELDLAMSDVDVAVAQIAVEIQTAIRDIKRYTINS